MNTYAKIVVTMLCCAISGTMQPMMTRNRMDTQELRTLWNTLLSLTTQDPHDIHMSGGYGQSISMNKQGLDQLIANAHQTGLVFQYKNLIAGRIPDLSFFLKSLLSENSLIMIAYLQNLYGNGNPFQYNPSAEQANDPYKNAVLGFYQPVGKQPITLTSYGLLNGMIDNIDNVYKEGLLSSAHMIGELYTNFLNSSMKCIKNFE